MPATVRDAVLSVIATFPRPPRISMATASVIGRSVDLETIRRLLDVPRIDVVAAAEEVQLAGLLVEVPDRGDVLSFSHDVVRDVFYQGLTAPRRCTSTPVGHTEQLREEERDQSGGTALHFKRASEL